MVVSGEEYMRAHTDGLLSTIVATGGSGGEEMPPFNHVLGASAFRRSRRIHTYTIFACFGTGRGRGVGGWKRRARPIVTPKRLAPRELWLNAKGKRSEGKSKDGFGELATVVLYPQGKYNIIMIYISFWAKLARMWRQ